MEQWLESVHSDGTELFVSNPHPELFETVTVGLRMYENAPVTHVFLRSNPNGIQNLTEMTPGPVRHGLRYWQAPLLINETRVPYQFYLTTADTIYYVTQKGITTYLPDHTYDFVLLADYVQPKWVKDAVFYQIFPDRFCNGDPANDVRSGEYSQDGHDSVAMGSWEAKPLTYEQGHCLDFFGGDLEGIRQKIPYLKKLGVTALYLNPIFFAPSVHKYDCLDYFHVDPHLGGDEALAELSAALHENGMKLVLDISINHTGIDHKWFNRDGAWFPKTQGAYNNPDSRERGYYFFREGNDYHGWMGVSTLPTLNYTSQELRDVIFRDEDSVLKKWLKPPYSIDGWRFDVADVFARNNELQLAGELWPQIRRSIRDVNPQAYILAEDWGDCAPYLQGDCWDSPMNYYGCCRVIREFLGQPDPFNSREPALRAVPTRMTAQDAKARILQHLAKIPYALWENQFNLFDSHDISRLHNDPAIGWEGYRGAVIFQFLLTGAPSIYYGDEAGADGVLGTNEGCRYPMPWGSGFEDGPYFRLYQTMIRCRKDHPALRRGGMAFLYAQGGVLALARFQEDEALVGVLSNQDRATTIRLPLGAVGGLEPEEEIFGGSLSWQKAEDGAIALDVPAHGSLLFTCKMM